MSKIAGLLSEPTSRNFSIMIEKFLWWATYFRHDVFRAGKEIPTSGSALLGMTISSIRANSRGFFVVALLRKTPFGARQEIATSLRSS